MASSRSLLSSVSSYVEAAGNRYTGRQALARWARSQPSLRPFRTIGEVVRSCRQAPLPEQDRLLGALVASAGGEPLGQLAVLAGLSRHLGSVLACWRRGGTNPVDLAVLEADLVSECWGAVALLYSNLDAGGPLPGRVSLTLVAAARHSVRTPLRRELRAAARRDEVEQLAGFSAAEERPVAEQLADEIGRAVRAGRISATAAAPVFLTRVAGYSTVEAAKALGHSPATLRALRSRAERSLVA